MIVKYRDPELMGISITWTSKVSDQAKKFLTKDQSKGINNTLVTNIHQKYLKFLSSGYQKPDFEKSIDPVQLKRWNKDGIIILNAIRRETNIPLHLIDSIMRSLWDLSNRGIIPLEKFDPKGVITDKELVKPIKQKLNPTIKNFTESLSNVATGTRNVLIFGAIAASLYFLNQLSKGVSYAKKEEN